MVSENQPANPPAQRPVASTESSQGAAGFLMIGAAIIVAGHILFSLFIGEFSFSAVYVSLAVLVLMSIFGWLGINLSVGTQKLIGYFLGVAALLLLLGDIRFGFPDEVVDNIANLVFYVGGFLMFAGARGLKA